MCLNIPDFQNIASLPSNVWLASINKDGKQNDSASQDLLLVKVLLLWMWMNSPAFFFLFTHALFSGAGSAGSAGIEGIGGFCEPARIYQCDLGDQGCEVASRQFACSDFGEVIVC